MMMVEVQRGSWPGWPDGVVVELEAETASAFLTAARDFQAETGVDLHGDILALPAGGLRLPAWIAEMQWAFDHRHDSGANKAQSVALYQKYNMDPASNARPATSSTHALGICGDVADNRFLNWLTANGTRYGLRRTLVALNDLRHFQFFPGTATVALDITSLDNASEGHTMFGFLYQPAGSWKFLVVPGLYIKNTPDNQAESALSLAGLTLGTVPDLATLHSVLWDAGFDDQFGGPGQPADGWALLQTLGGGKTLFTSSWTRVQTPGAVDVASLAAAIVTALVPHLPATSAGPTADAIATAVVKAEGAALSNG